LSLSGERELETKGDVGGEVPCWWSGFGSLRGEGESKESECWPVRHVEREELGSSMAKLPASDERIREAVGG
jgi:hypothetical protein